MPHFYLTSNIEIDALLKLRADLNAKSPKEGPSAFKLSVNDLVIKACALALRRHPQVDLHYVDGTQRPPAADLIILPGSKNVRADLEWLRLHGWSGHLQRHLRYGGRLLGICGGFQMLGRCIEDSVAPRFVTLPAESHGAETES